MTVSLLSLGLVAVPIVAAQETPEQGSQMPAGPGTVNYVEGAVYVDAQPVTRNQIGNVGLDAGQELSTGAGKAEVLLTPGVFLRVDSNSVVKMISPQSTLMQVELEKGRAAVEVDEIHNENNLQIIDANIATRLQKTGYYEFDASHPEVMVFKGKADVDVPNAKGKEVKGNHELLLADAATGQPLADQKPQELNDNRATDELFNWSKLRSQYLSESNNEMADEYADAYPGWYWDPYMWDYTYIGAGPFYSPFGWGFAPMGWGGWYGGGYGYGGYGYGGGYGGRYYGRGGPYRFGGTHARGGAYHGGSSHVGGFRGGMGGGGFRGGMGGGGFHGGGGGFHGGGGGFHR